MMRSRYEIARRSAWAHFGRRHHGLIVGLDVARWLAGPVSFLVLLGGTGWALWWAWDHVSARRLAASSALAGVLLLVGYAVYQIATGAGVKRAAMGRRLSGPGAAVLASVVLLFGASISALVR